MGNVDITTTLMAHMATPIALVGSDASIAANAALKLLAGLAETEEISPRSVLADRLTYWAQTACQSDQELLISDAVAVPVSVACTTLMIGAESAVMLEIVDQSKARIAAQALDEALGSFNLLARSAPFGVWDQNRRTGAWYFSPKVYSLLGLPLDTQADPRALFEQVVLPDDMAMIRSKTAAAFKDRSLYSANFRARLPDGTIQTLHATGLARYDDDGSVARFVGTLQLQSAMEAGGFSEPLVNATPAPSAQLNPLAKLKARLNQVNFKQADPVASAKPVPPHVQEALVALAQTSQRAFLSVMDDLMELSALESGATLAPAAPFNVLASFHAMTKEGAAAHANLSHIMDARANADFIGQSGSWRRVVQLMIGHACARSAGGQVETSLSVGETGHGLLFEVRDSGGHIGEHALEAVFQIPDTQPKPDSDVVSDVVDGGWQIGFYLARILARRMGGELAASNHQGQGVTWRLYVPFERAIALPEYTLMQGQTLMDTNQANSGSLQVLVVEDNLANQRVISIILQQLGCVVTIAENGQEGVETFLKGHFDLVLMDLHMPVMDGYAATRAIRASGFAGQEALIVALTADARTEAMVEAEAAGVDDFLTKPVVLAQIAAVVARALELGEERDVILQDRFSRSA